MNRQHQKPLLDSETDFLNIVDSWTEFYEQASSLAFKENDKLKILLSDEEIFSEAYSYLISSPYLETMLQLEYDYQSHLDYIVRQREKEIYNLKTRNKNEMDIALSQQLDDKTISMLANKQSDDLHLLESRWDSTLCSSKTLHKKEFREWVMKVYEDDMLKSPRLKDTKAKSKEYNFISETIIPSTHPTKTLSHTYVKDVIREESFTINLGNQLKLSHNLRVIKCPLIEHFCGKVMPTFTETNSLTGDDPFSNRVDNDLNARKLQTSLSLYSNRLSALITLEEARDYTNWSADSGIEQIQSKLLNCKSDYRKNLLISNFTPKGRIYLDLTAICERQNEYHFPELEQQLDLARREAANDLNNNVLSPGDVYITRHSNLTDVQVIFHLCTDDGIKKGSQELTSRHPLFAGLRNIFKTCCLFEITSITLPLLLVSHITEEMTMSWCHKRAELVFKCVKGFMMEMQGWGCTETKIVQFHVPANVCDEAFDSITAMLPNIFRLPAPISTH